MKKKKPVILLDCDGVLADFTTEALDLIEQETGKRYTPEEIPHWEVFESLGHPELWAKFGEKADQIGYCASMKPYPAALVAVKKFQETYEVLIVTAPVDARPWMYERAHWIGDHFGISRKKVIFAHEKQQVRGDMLVDDKPANVIAWAAANPEGIAVLWSHPYNRVAELPEGIVRTSDWNELATMLREKFDED